LKGPIPITKTSHPWNGAAWQNTPIDLKKYGYVEEEYLASGTANVYNWQPNANYKVDVTGSAKYTTRVTVRRPINMKKFSGRVVVEIINMSAVTTGPRCGARYGSAYSTTATSMWASPASPTCSMG
jgi:hypothetical protein